MRRLQIGPSSTTMVHIAVDAERCELPAELGAAEKETAGTAEVSVSD